MSALGPDGTRPRSRRGPQGPPRTHPKRGATTPPPKRARHRNLLPISFFRCFGPFSVPFISVWRWPQPRCQDPTSRPPAHTTTGATKHPAGGPQRGPDEPAGPTAGPTRGAHQPVTATASFTAFPSNHGAIRPLRAGGVARRLSPTLHYTRPGASRVIRGVLSRYPTRFVVVSRLEGCENRHL